MFIHFLLSGYGCPSDIKLFGSNYRMRGVCLEVSDSRVCEVSSIVFSVRAYLGISDIRL